jgi:hypothetical protein
VSSQPGEDCSSHGGEDVSGEVSVEEMLVDVGGVHRLDIQCWFVFNHS